MLILSHDWLNYKQIHNLNYRLLALVHMLLYSFYVSFTAKKTSHKIGLTAFSIVFPIASGFMLYFFKQVLKIGAR
ncbi:hypothetical protein [Vibrio metschnikovii]|uniref:hypothetical protein n=1 Tax=Vibrio metschnikovii TaxID=28172 RepID=UPI0020C5C348|nr:hypothetical protein [Vibrio metschnikovii]